MISGDIRPIIHETMPLSEARKAHTALEEGTSIGKVLLIADESAQNAKSAQSV
ncbi:MAG: zinc-binding dehydrogenase [Brevibacterium aurantiacum]|uniref:zinc-binding dehydrogenase n=1 Tax=Brevibacterium aurantiacum TaxID=273384 RepID=UPI003F8EBDCA